MATARNWHRNGLPTTAACTIKGLAGHRFHRRITRALRDLLWVFHRFNFIGLNDLNVVLQCLRKVQLVCRGFPHNSCRFAGCPSSHQLTVPKLSHWPKRICTQLSSMNFYRTSLPKLDASGSFWRHPHPRSSPVTDWKNASQNSTSESRIAATSVTNWCVGQERFKSFKVTPYAEQSDLEWSEDFWRFNSSNRGILLGRKVALNLYKSRATKLTYIPYGFQQKIYI